MDDVISRQAALDAFEKELSAKYNRHELAIGFVGVKSILENMPSAQPERKKGEWIPIYHGNKAMFYQCPYCGARYMLQTRFCGNCGKVVYHE